ncbi:MAG: threonine-phosphate decarboxylase CobD [Thermoleophilia bacterium]|jgi:threonine-phosphate decarboxylase
MGEDIKNVTRKIIEVESAPAHGGRRMEAQRRFGIPKEELLDFSASINLLGPSPDALAAVRAATSEIAYYPEEDCAGLLATVADHLGVFPDEVVLGNGSIEIIYWLAVVLEPRRVLVIEPTFSEYRNACEAAGADCDSFQLLEQDAFALDVAQIQPSGYDLIFLCNPNNPTGYLVPLDEVAALWRKCRGAGAGLVVDEAFIDFAGHEESILSFGATPGLYVVRSFTKSHALAGLRLGCLAATARFTAVMRKRIPPWNVNAFARAAGKATLTDWDYMSRTRRETAKARARLFDDLSGVPGVEPLPSEANFLLCRLTGTSSDELTARLAIKGILVRDCRSFAGLASRYIRVAVRSERENYQLVDAIRKAVR